MFKCYKQSKLDLVALQETHGNQSVEQRWRMEWGGEIVCSHGENCAQGVLLAIAPGSGFVIEEHENVIPGRVLWVKLAGPLDLSVLVVYAHTPPKPQFFETVKEFLEHKSDENLVVMGDFNIVFDEIIDRDPSRKKGAVTPAKTKLLEILSENDLTDVYRLLHPQGREFTWFRPANKQMSRIDMMLVSSSLVPLLMEIKSDRNAQSDHSVVIVEIQTNDENRGPGLWKFNNKLLDDEMYVEKIRTLFKDFEIDKPDQERWEYLKYCIRKETIRFAKEKVQQRSRVKKLFEAKLERIHFDLLNEHDPNKLDKLWQREANLLEFLRGYEQERAEATMFRSGCRWYEEGERSNKYFHGLEKRNFLRKTLSHCRVEGKLISEGKMVREAMRSYFEDLYKDEERVAGPDVLFEEDRDLAPQVPTEYLEMLGREICEDELFMALKGMARNKTPGSDGLTVNFYQFFWAELKGFLVPALMTALDENRLFPSAHDGVVLCIPKPNRNLELIKNWRPITLLNVDYKILSKLIAERFKIVFPQIIHEDQTGFVKGRRIQDNLRIIQDLIDVIRHEKEPSAALLVSIDFQKCFDSISWEAILAALRTFGFPENIRSWIKLMLEESRACILNNGFTSNYFQCQKGTKQGDPVSSYLAVLVLEILANRLRAKLPGIKILEEVSLVLSQFADDLNVFLNHKQNELDVLVQQLEKFYVETRLQINYDKTTVYRITSKNHSIAKLYSRKPLNWSNEPLMVLGFQIGMSHTEVFRQLYLKAEMKVKRWMRRNLSLFGKALVWNSEILATFSYFLTVGQWCDESELKEINKLKNLLFWGNGKPKIAKSKMCQTERDGGLNVMDFEKRQIALKLSLLQNVQNNDKLKALAARALGLPYFIEFWHTNISKTHLEKLFNQKKDTFWFRTWLEWSKIVHYDPLKQADIVLAVRAQILWFNSFVKVQKLPVWWKEWQQKGIVRLNDVLTERGDLITKVELQEKLGKKIHWFEYFKFRTMIPRRWLEVVRGVFFRDKIKFGPNRIFEVMCKPVKLMYKALVKDDSVMDDLTRFWNEFLKLELTQTEMSMQLINTSKITTVPKLKSFRWRILHRKIYTNSSIVSGHFRLTFSFSGFVPF